MAEEQVMETHLTKISYRAKSPFLLAEMWKDGTLCSEYCNVCGTRPAAKKSHEGLQTLLQIQLYAHSAQGHPSLHESNFLKKNKN